MPPPWHSFTASIASLRGGSSSPIRPSRTRFFGRSAAVETAGLDARILEPRQPQHALALAGELVRRLHEMVAIERRWLSVRGLLPVAVLEDDLRRALDEQDLLAVGRLVQRRHELVLRFERDGVDPRVRGLLGLPVHPELGRERIERALGRIALHLPDAFLLEQLRVVAEHRDAPHELEHRVLARRLPVLLDLALRRVAVAGDLIRRLGGDGRDHHHFHERQRAGLVGADARYRAQRFDRRQAPDDGVALRHALHADRKRDGDERRQAFRDDRHRDADDRLEDLHEVHALHPLAIGEDQDANYSDDGGDRVAELLDLAQERRLERADARRAAG